MFHQFNKVTGRLVAASHLQSPLFPVAPIRLQRVEAPAITYTAPHMSTVTEVSASSGSKKLIPGTDVPYGKLPDSIRKKQELFQKDNGVPVFIKGGMSDQILYRFTLLLCALGFAGALEYIYSKAYPPKN